MDWKTDLQDRIDFTQRHVNQLRWMVHPMLAGVDSMELRKKLTKLANSLQKELDEFKRSIEWDKDE